MKHFTTGEWIDFANQVTSGDKDKAMQKHLGSGCKRCAESVALWQKARNTAATEAGYQPPAETVRVVKAAFASPGSGGKQKRTSSWVEVVFDSFLQPALAGARSAGTATRHMLCRADPYQIDIQIEAKPEGNRLVITGQLLDISRPDVVGPDVQVTLSNRRGNLVHTLTNRFGEFREEILNTGDLELAFIGPAEKPIVISLRDALGQQSGDPV
jgi:hypothetical protein